MKAEEGVYDEEGVGVSVGAGWERWRRDEGVGAFWVSGDATLAGVWCDVLLNMASSRRPMRSRICSMWVAFILCSSIG